MVLDCPPKIPPGFGHDRYDNILSVIQTRNHSLRRKVKRNYFLRRKVNGHLEQNWGEESNFYLIEETDKKRGLRISFVNSQTGEIYETTEPLGLQQPQQLEQTAGINPHGFAFKELCGLRPNEHPAEYV